MRFTSSSLWISYAAVCAALARPVIIRYSSIALAKMNRSRDICWTQKKMRMRPRTRGCRTGKPLSVPDWEIYRVKRESNLSFASSYTWRQPKRSKWSMAKDCTNKRIQPKLKARARWRVSKLRNGKLDQRSSCENSIQEVPEAPNDERGLLPIHQHNFHYHNWN
jgi:hypothetical protein